MSANIAESSNGARRGPAATNKSIDIAWLFIRRKLKGPQKGPLASRTLKAYGRMITAIVLKNAFCENWAVTLSEVVEMALAHTIENRVEAAYRRADLLEKRRALMETWATYCLTPMLTIVGRAEK